MIGAEEQQMLSDLVSIVNSLALPMILVGAGARRLIFDQEFGEGRATTDWDIAVSVESWEIYDRLCLSLTTDESPQFKSTKTPHRFIHIGTNVAVDIVPFGEISSPEKEITWPDSGNSMNVSGFAEALLYARSTTIGELEIKVIDLPAFIVLKIFAWGDRGERTNKDLEDLDFVFSNYRDDERVYDELIDEMSDGIVDFVDADVYLLGQDIGGFIQHKTLAKFSSLLIRLIQHLDDDEPRSLGYRLEVLQQGVRSISSVQEKK